MFPVAPLGWGIYRLVTMTVASVRQGPRGALRAVWPTEAFLEWAGLEVSDAAIASHYAGLADGLVVDRSSPSGAPTLSGLVMHEADTLMADADARVRLARETLDFAQSLAG